MVEDSVLDNRAVMIGGTTGILGEWGPEREDNRYEGAMTARQALTKSKNGATVRVGMEAGVDKVLKLSAAAGVAHNCGLSRQRFSAAAKSPSLNLLWLTPFSQMADGVHGRRTLLIESRKKTGTSFGRTSEDTGRRKVVKPEIAYEVHSCLVDALENGTGRFRTRSIWPQENPGRGQNRNGLRFYRRALRRLRQRDHLRGLDGLRQAAKDLPRRLRQQDCATGMGGHNERLDYADIHRASSLGQRN